MSIQTSFVRAITQLELVYLTKVERVLHVQVLPLDDLRRPAAWNDYRGWTGHAYT